MQNEIPKVKISLKDDATPGLPDRLFSILKNPDLGKIWKALEWEIML
jgi:hypothetical protein